jgi:soluble lytic murein transglycosylase-like protein
MVTIATRLLGILITTLALFTAVTCHADCFDAAAKYQRVSPTVLRAIAQVESQNNPHAINRNRNGTVDLGVMQINSIHLRELNKYGIHRRDLMNSCKNIYTGAWLLRQKVDRYGNTWKAIGSYHSETPALRRQYARLVQREVRTMDVMRLASN